MIFHILMSLSETFLVTFWTPFRHRFFENFQNLQNRTYSKSWKYFWAVWALKTDYRQQTADSLLTQTARKQTADSWTIDLNGKQTCRPSDRRLVICANRSAPYFHSRMPLQSMDRRIFMSNLTFLDVANFCQFVLSNIYIKNGTFETCFRQSVKGKMTARDIW